MTDEQAAKVALVIGAGDSTGGAIAKRFAAGGYVACVTRRDAAKLQPLIEAIEAAGGRAHGFGSDARKEDEVVALVERIEREIGPIDVLVFNIGANVPSSILEETARKYFKIWEMACFGGFLNGREVARRMVARGRGTILFTGATASLRGAAQLRRVRRRQARAARAGAEHGARAGAAGRARRARRRRRRDRHRVHPQQLSRALRAEGAGRHPEPRAHRRELLAPAHASRATPGRSSSTCGRGTNAGSLASHGAHCAGGPAPPGRTETTPRRHRCERCNSSSP